MSKGRVETGIAFTCKHKICSLTQIPVIFNVDKSSSEFSLLQSNRWIENPAIKPRIENLAPRSTKPVHNTTHHSVQLITLLCGITGLRLVHFHCQ